MFGSRRRRHEQHARHSALVAALRDVDVDARPRASAWRTGRAALFRWRRQLAPLVVLGGLWVVGWVVDVEDVPAGTVAAGALLAAAALWRLRYGPRLDRPRERLYAATCLASAVVWLTATATVGLVIEQLLIVGGAALSAPWWAHHAARTAPRAEPAAPGIEQLWAANVAAPGYALPGATLSVVGAFEHGNTYRVQLDPGRQTLATAQAALPLISTGLRMPLDELVIERDPGRDPSQLRMQVITASPIRETVLFDRPRFDGGRIHLGPHADGIGEATYRLYTRNSMWGGFVLGSIGSGKSRMIETIALTARAMGAVLIYVDGQDGASSSVLWRHAAFRAGADSARALVVIEQIMTDRQRVNVEHELAGFTPSADRPGILIIVDECHVPFAQYGDRWAHVARTSRKLGLAVLAADQYSDLKVFGGLEPLRSSLLAGNGYALRTNSRMAGHLLPGLDLDPYDLPALPGYGYAIAAKGSDARTAPFRGRYLPDRDDLADDPSIGVPSVQDWFERVPAVPLDPLAQHSMDVALDVALAALDIAAKRKAGLGSPTEVEDAVTGMYPKAEPEPAGTTADRVLTLVAEHGGPMRLAEVLAALQGAKVDTVQRALKQLVDRGALARAGHGVYEVPTR